MQVTASRASSMIAKYIQARLVPMLIGSPGCGKSQVVHQIAQKYNLKVIDLRLSQCDPTDLLGFPNIMGNKAGYLPMNTFPIEGDPIPDGYSGWLLFFDEFNSAPPSVQAAAYKVILDRMVGTWHIHKNVAMVCAGNLETDNAIVQPMSTAMQSRLVHLELIVDHKEWVDHAASEGWDRRITSHISFKPGNLFTFKPDHTDHTYGCPRTWEFTNRLMQVVDPDSPEFLPLLAGTLSEGLAREFITFCKIEATLPKMVDLIAKPESTPVPVETSVLFALTGSIAHNATKDNIEPLMKYVNRMPVEFQVVCLRGAVRRNKALAASSPIQKWIASCATDLF